MISTFTKLQDQLIKLKQHAEIVAQDRDNLRILYEQVRNELQLCRESKTPMAFPAPPVTNPPLSVDKVESIQKESQTNDQVQLDQDEFIRLQEELTSCKKQVEFLTNLSKQNQEKIHLLEIQLSNAEISLDGKNQEITCLKSTISTFEKNEQNSQEEISSHLKTIDMLKVTLAQLESSRDKEREQLKQIKLNSSDLDIVIQKQSLELARLQHLVDDKQRMVDEQRELLKHIDKERDEIQSDMDLKAETIVDLQENLKINNSLGVSK